MAKLKQAPFKTQDHFASEEKRKKLDNKKIIVGNATAIDPFKSDELVIYVEGMSPRSSS